MSFLTDRVPEQVEIGGIAYPINTDFRVGIRFEQAILSGEPDGGALLALYYPAGLPPDPQGAVERIMWFYQCGPEATEGGGTEKGARSYDFDQDEDAIFVSFRTAYGIDLSTADLHWWVFRKLLFGLPEDTAFMRRILYRTADTKGMGKREREHYRKMKALYAIKSRTGPKESLEQRNQRMKDHIAKRLGEACQA